MSSLTLGNVTIDRARFEVWVAERRVDLTYVEFELLWELARNARQVMPRHRLMRSVWHEHPSTCDRKISVHVSRLRRKLRGSSPFVIETYAKRGYALTTRVRDDALAEPVTTGAQPLAGLALAFSLGSPQHHIGAFVCLIAVCLSALVLADGDGGDSLSDRLAMAGSAVLMTLVMIGVALKMRLGSVRSALVSAESPSGAPAVGVTFR